MLVSIIIPCFNVEAYVEECVASALAQTRHVTEIICVDDGSSDATLSILRRLEAQHPTRLTILTGKNQGAPAARNKGLSAAKGEYLVFLDADDLLMPTKIAHQVKLVQKAAHPPDLIAASFLKAYRDGRTVTVEVEQEDVWVSLLKTRLGCTPANLWRKAALKSVGGWNESLRSSQEADLMFRLLQAGAKVSFDETCLTLVRVREGSISTSNLDRISQQYVELRYEILRYLRKADLLTTERTQAAYQAIFDTLRTLYEYDVKAAARLSREIPKTFSPTATSKTYLMLYKLFGFERAERIRAAQKRAKSSLTRINFLPKRNVT